MPTFPLIVQAGHLFVEVEGHLWLVDTGSPSSFGESKSLRIDGIDFTLNESYFGLNAQTISGYINVPCSGLIGMDILGRFDHIFDTVEGTLTVSSSELRHEGECIEIDELMGIPIVSARIGDHAYRMFFDTGAQISYFQDDSLRSFEYVGSFTDFYPNIGSFETDTYHVPVSIGRNSWILKCGSLPGLLGTTLMMMADTQGVIGNSVMTDRVVGFYPRRHLLEI